MIWRCVCYGCGDFAASYDSVDNDAATDDAADAVTDVAFNDGDSLL